jgi:hypothetical protein
MNGVRRRYRCRDISVWNEWLRWSASIAGGSSMINRKPSGYTGHCARCRDTGIMTSASGSNCGARFAALASPHCGRHDRRASSEQWRRVRPDLAARVEVAAATGGGGQRRRRQRTYAGTSIGLGHLTPLEAPVTSTTGLERELMCEACRRRGSSQSRAVPHCRG